MSNTLERIDIKAGMVQWLGALSHFFSKDVLALPADKLAVSPGGVARAPRAIIGEVIGLLKYTTKTLRNEEPENYAEDHGERFVAGLSTAEELVGAFQAASADLSAAIMAAPDDIWMNEVMPPWQMKDTVFGITNVAINHIWYHDGQINTYQCLYGDDKVHWMD